MRLPVRYFAPGPVWVDPKIRKAVTMVHCETSTGVLNPLEPIPLIYALDVQLDRLLEEGIEERWRRHRNLRKRTEAWAASAGFQYASQEGAGSPTVSCLKTPSGLAASDLVDKLAQQGFVVGSGYGRFKDSSFRIGHMAEIGSADLELLFGAIGASIG